MVSREKIIIKESPNIPKDKAMLMCVAASKLMLMGSFI